MYLSFKSHSFACIKAQFGVFLEKKKILWASESRYSYIVCNFYCSAMVYNFFVFVWSGRSCVSIDQEYMKLNIHIVEQEISEILKK